MNFKMIRFLPVLFSLSGFLLLNCSRQSNTEATKQALFNTDREFSQMSVEKGSLQAFHFYLAEEGKVLSQNGVLRTKQDFGKFVELAKDKKSSDTLTWDPLFADIARSGDLGYTYGTYNFTTTDALGARQTTHGYYVTIWKKQDDGTWRFVFDTGSETGEGQAG